MSVTSESEVKVRDLREISRTEELKTLTPKTRRQIFQKDQCCQFVDKTTGRQCGSTFLLEIDHRTSRWAGGTHSLGNLQVLCAGHNKNKYQKESGIRLK